MDWFLAVAQSLGDSIWLISRNEYDLSQQTSLTSEILCADGASNPIFATSM
jgi:hypothetical protein